MGTIWDAICPSLYVLRKCTVSELTRGWLIDWYYLAFPKDKWIVKSLVAFIYLMELAQTIIITRDCFQTFAYGFGDVNKLEAMQTEWLAVPVFTAVGTFTFLPKFSGC